MHWQLGLVVAVSMAGCQFTVAGTGLEAGAVEPDLSAAPDGASEDLAGRDLSLSGDLAGLDLAAGPAADLAGLDLSGQLASTDLQQPDLQMPDLRMPDLRMPDLRMPDLRMPDMAPSPSPSPSPSGCPAARPDPVAPIVPIHCVDDNTITVDGNLLDWVGATFLPLNHANAELSSGTWGGVELINNGNSSGQYALRWDQHRLYLAVLIFDDTRRADSSATIYQNDAVELFLDGDHGRTLSYGADDHQLVVREDNVIAEFKNSVAQGSITAGVVSATVETQGFATWTVEVAVPWSALGAPMLAAGTPIGFDLAIDDNDAGGATRDRYLLRFNQPSGSAGCTQAACSTAAFGTAQLTGR